MPTYAQSVALKSSFFIENSSPDVGCVRSKRERLGVCKKHSWLDPLIRRGALERADVDALLAILERQRTIRKKSDIIIEGYKCRKLCFIEDGIAARYKLMRNGRRQILSILLPGDITGLAASFYKKAQFSIVALTDMTIHTCSSDTFTRLCYQRPNLAMALFWYAVEGAADLSEHVVNAGRRTPLERTAHLLLELHARLEQVGRVVGETFALPLSQEVIGDTLGLSTAHVNRMLHRLKALGLVAIEGRNVKLNDFDALETIAQFQRWTLCPNSLPE